MYINRYQDLQAFKQALARVKVGTDCKVRGFGTVFNPNEAHLMSVCYMSKTQVTLADFLGRLFTFSIKTGKAVGVTKQSYPNGVIESLDDGEEI